MATQAMPLDFDPERAVLGGVLADNAKLQAVEAIIRVEHLSHASNRAVYAAMLAMSEGGQPIDLVTLKGALAEAGELERIGGVGYIAGLLDGMPRGLNVEAWARMVRERARRKWAVALCHRTIELAADASLETDLLIDQAQVGLAKLMESGERQIVSLAEVLRVAMRDLEEFATSATGVTGIATGLPELDQLTGGLKPGRLWVVAARFARGKSALSSQIALHAARQGKNVLVIGMEMPPEESAGRMLVTAAGIDKWALRHETQRADKEHSLSWARVFKAYGEMSALPLYFDRHEAPNLAQIKVAARSQRSAHGLDLLVIDYIQRATLDATLVKASGIWAGVGEIVQGFKSLARNLNIPVIAASQLNSAAQEKEPTLADFAQAQGAIGAEADCVLFLHPKEVATFDQEAIAPMHLLVKKHRGGACMAINVNFHKAQTMFKSMEQEVWRGEL